MNRFFIAFVLFAVLLSSCASQRRAERLALHNDKLIKMAASDASAEQKFDALAGSLVDMMHEALRPVNPKKGGEYVRDYFKMNNKPMDKIFGEMVEMQQNLGSGQKALFGLKMVTKPYFMDLVTLVPRFIQKYKTYKFAINGMKRVKSGLINSIGGGKPGFNLGEKGIDQIFKF